jgi:hypothetical protein
VQVILLHLIPSSPQMLEELLRRSLELELRYHVRPADRQRLITVWPA